MNMVEKARAVAEKFEELTSQMSDPEYAADGVALGRIGKERARLEPTAKAYYRVVEIERSIEAARGALADADLAGLAREELASLDPAQKEALVALEDSLIAPDPDADRNVIVEIRQGSGGEEAALWAADLFRMYSRYAESRGWKIEHISSSEAEMGGLKEIVFGVNGGGAWDALQTESGVHRVQRVPATEQKGRIHTSAATVAVLPEAEEVDVEINDNDVEMETMRSSGAGGQNVQKK